MRVQMEDDSIKKCTFVIMCDKRCKKYGSYVSHSHVFPPKICNTFR